MLIVKTESGQQVMKDRSVALTPRQRSAFILVDGKRSLEQVLAATASTGVTRADIDRLLELALIAKIASKADGSAPAAAPGASASEAMAPAAGPAGKSPQERYAEAYPIAIRLTSALGLRGFRLNLAVEGASSLEELLQVAPKIREAVGPERFLALEQVLGAR